MSGVQDSHELDTTINPLSAGADAAKFAVVFRGEGHVILNCRDSGFFMIKPGTSSGYINLRDFKNTVWIYKKSKKSNSTAKTRGSLSSEDNAAAEASADSNQIPDHPNVIGVLYDEVTEIPVWASNLIKHDRSLCASTSSKGAAAGGAWGAPSIPRLARVVVTERIECTLRQHLENIKQALDHVPTIQLLQIASDIAEGAHHLLQHGVDLSDMSLDHVMWTTDAVGYDESKAGRAVLCAPVEMKRASIEAWPAASSAVHKSSAKNHARSEVAGSTALGRVLKHALKVYNSSASLSDEARSIRRFQEDVFGARSFARALALGYPDEEHPAAATTPHVLAEAAKLRQDGMEKRLDVGRDSEYGRCRVDGNLILYRSIVAALLDKASTMSIRRACALLRPVDHCNQRQDSAAAMGASSNREHPLIRPGTVEELLAVTYAEKATLAGWAMQALTIVLEADRDATLQAVEAAGVAPQLVCLLGSKDGYLSSAALNACALVSLGSRVLTLQLLDAGAIQTLVHLLQSKDESRDTVGGNVIINMLSHEEAAGPAVAAGVLPVLTQILRTGSVGLRSLSLTCLSLLSARAEAKQAIIDSDVLPALAGMPGDAVEEEGKTGAQVLDTIRSRESAQVISALAKGTTVPSLLAIVREPAINKGMMGIKKIAVYLIVTYSIASKRMRDSIVNAGAVPELIKLLGSTNAKVRRMSCKTLRNLCVRLESSACGQAIVDAGAIPALVPLLSPCNTVQSDSAVVAIFWLSQQAPRVAQEVLGCGATPHLIAMLESPRRSDVVLAASTLCQLLALTDEQTKSALMEAAIPGIVRLLRSNHDASQDEQAARVAQVLSSCCRENASLTKTAIEAGSIPELSRMVCHEDSQQAKAAAWAIGNILRVSSESQLAFHRSGAIPGLVALLGSKHGPTQEVAAHALVNLAVGLQGREEHEVRSAIVQAGAVPALAALMQQPMEQPAACIWACEVVQNLSGGDEVCVSAIMEAGVLPVVLEQLEAQGTRAHCSLMAILHQLSLRGGNRVKEQIVSAGVLPIIVSSLSLTYEERDEDALATIQTLAEGGLTCKLAVVESRAIAALIPHLDSTDQVKLEHAVWALYDLSQGAHEICQMAAASAIQPLACLMRTRTDQLKVLAALTLKHILLGPEPVRRVLAQAGVLPEMLEVLGSPPAPDPEDDVRVIQEAMEKYGSGKDTGGEVVIEVDFDVGP